MMIDKKIIKLLNFTDEENTIFMPNEIFEELAQCKSIKSSSHISLAYSYVYLITWLYRYAKYISTTDNITQNKLKEILGYNGNDKRINYLIKKNGILEQLKYLETKNDYPVAWQFEEGSGGLSFIMYSDCKCDEIDEYFNMGNNFKIKYPVKAFNRYPEENEDCLDGTFYQIDNSHLIPFEVFLYCMNNKNIGCIGFYLWSYLKSKNQIFPRGYDISLQKLSQATGIKKRTVDKYLTALKEYKMINFHHNQDFFFIGLKGQGKPNTYITNDYNLFLDEPIEFDRIKVIEYQKYLERQQKEQEQGTQTVNIALDELPY